MIISRPRENEAFFFVKTKYKRTIEIEFKLEN